MNDVALYLDQDNELLFKVSIEGSKPGTPKYRLVFEGKDMSYSVLGHQASAGEVAFTVPSMKNIIKEGNYRANLEVMVDDRFFTPLTFNAEFEESIRVTVESATRPLSKKPTVSAAIMTSRPATTKTIVENHNKPVKRQPHDDSSIGEIDGRKVTVDDLRSLIRSRK